MIWPYNTMEYEEYISTDDSINWLPSYHWLVVFDEDGLILNAEAHVGRILLDVDNGGGEDYWNFMIERVNADGFSEHEIFSGWNELEESCGFPDAQSAMEAAERYYFKHLDGLGLQSMVIGIDLGAGDFGGWTVYSGGK